MTAQDVIQAIQDAGGTSRQAILDALCYGAALAAIGVTDDDQEAFEAAFNLVKSSQWEWLVEDEDGDVIGVFYSEDLARDAARKNAQCGGWEALVFSRPAK